MTGPQDEVATPFVTTEHDLGALGYDCSCDVPSVYRRHVDDDAVETIFWLCPVCDNLPSHSLAQAWGSDISDEPNGNENVL